MANLALACVMAVQVLVAGDETKVLPTGGQPSDRFGASVDVSGDLAIFGAPLDDGDGPSLGNAGSAYVYVRSGSDWVQEAKLTAAVQSANARFGTSVAIEGNRAIIGAPFDDDVANDSGAAYVFERSGTTWTQIAKVVASDGYALASFGYRVALSGDRFAVASAGADLLLTSDVNGAVYTFVRNGSTWAQEARQATLAPNLYKTQGPSLELAGDMLLAGDPAYGPGVVRVFDYNGSSWSEGPTIAAPGGADFGTSLSLSGDTLLVGDPGAGTGSGVAHAFTRTAGVWSLEATLHPSGAFQFEQFGTSVGLRGDVAWIGSPASSDGEDFTGAVHMFLRTGSTWVAQAELRPVDLGNQDEFGIDVAVGDGFALVGADRADVTGAVFAYRYLSPALGSLDTDIGLVDGGAQQLFLDAGTEQAFGLYWILGSLSGTQPGLPLSPTSLVLPLNFDAYFLFTVQHPNTLIPASLGLLDQDGRAGTSFGLPAGTDLSLLGITLQHAYFVLDLVTFLPVFVSNPVPVVLTF